MRETYEDASRRAKTLAGMFGTAWLLTNGADYIAVGHDTERYFYTNERNGFGYMVEATFTKVWNGHWFAIEVKEGEVCTQ